MSSKPLLEIAEGFRLSPQQNRVWNLHEKHPGSELGIQCTVSIHGLIDNVRMSKAVDTVRSRHEILRTSFDSLEGVSVPVQRIVESAVGALEVVDLRGQSGTRHHPQWLPVAKEHWNRVQKLIDAPAMSFLLVTLSEAEHLLVLTASALCADVPSVLQVVREIQRAYSNRDLEDREVLQYADLSEWQNQLLENSAVDDHTPYWKAPEFSELPFPRFSFELRRETNTDEFSFKTISRCVPTATADALIAIAKQLDVPLHVILLSAWQMALGRMSSAVDFQIGISMEGRVLPELCDAVGLFTKVLPFSVHLGGNLQFGELLEQTSRVLKTVDSDQQLFDWTPFGMPDPSQRRHLFPLIFTGREQALLESSGPAIWELESLVESLETFELKLNAVISAGALNLEFSWESSTFAQTDVLLVADCYSALLEEIAKNPDRRIDEFCLGSASIASFPQQTASVQEGEWLAIHDLIKKQARRVPKQLAVICEDDQITYAELDRRASVLAHRLEQAGAAPDRVVAIVAERSVDFVVGILAVMKAGAAWLPIEPDVPAERVEYMLAASHAIAVLTQRSLTQPFDFGVLPVVYLGDHEGSVARNLRTHRKVDPQQLAYVIFTSGSTGRPKGVAIEHRQIANYVRGGKVRLKLGDHVRFALVSTMAADLGHSSVFGALCSGGCLHVIPSWRCQDMDALARYFLEHPVDFVKIVPAHLEALCGSVPDSARLSWRYLLVGGEALTWPLVELVRRVAPDCVVVNHYGPTETAVGVFCGEANQDSECFSGSIVPMGHSWPGSSAYLLDARLQPVPVWTPGELHIGGESVGRGYVGRGDLTAERFIPDPFSPIPGSRMYCTGDFARLRSDGAVQFIGRRDGQVKIRGYRVEPGEVEVALCRHPEVRNVAVVVVDRGTAGKQLVAWVAVGSARVTPEELRSFAERTLPHYMVPGTFVCVERLNLTPNGKVDRQALPREIPEPCRAEVAGPMDETEENLLTVWKKVLGAERIGVEDNYFALGGDSLRVVQLVHEARRYGIIIAAADVLRHQTIRRLARALHEKVRQGLFPDGLPPAAPPSADILRLVPADVVDVYPISGIQSFILAKYGTGQGSRGVYHIQDYCRIRDPKFSLAALEAAYQAVVQRHPALRTVFDLQSSPPMQWVRRKLLWKIDTRDISMIGAEEQEQCISKALRSDRARLFDVSDRETPLFRVAVFLRGSGEFDLLFSCHHAIMDGWGHRVLQNQLIGAYIDARSSVKAQLGEPDATYREFVAFQEAVRNSSRASDFWSQYLAHVNFPGPLHAATPAPHPDGAEIVHRLEPAMSAALMRVARDWAVSMQALLLSVWFETLRVWSEEELVVTGVIVNGRSEHLTDPLSAVGLFWNIVPLVSRTALALPLQAASVQKDLVEIEPYASYPLPQLQANQGGRELFYSVFRYLNFWNDGGLPDNSDMEVLDVRAYDRYSFPLLCSVVIHSEGGYVQLEYDPDSLPLERAKVAMNHYMAILQKIVANPES